MLAGDLKEALHERSNRMNGDTTAIEEVEKTKKKYHPKLVKSRSNRSGPNVKMEMNYSNDMKALMGGSDKLLQTKIQPVDKIDILEDVVVEYDQFLDNFSFDNGSVNGNISQDQEFEMVEEVVEICNVNHSEQIDGLIANQNEMMKRLTQIEENQKIIVDKMAEILATCQNILIQSNGSQQVSTHHIQPEETSINFNFDDHQDLIDFNQKLGTDKNFKSRLVCVKHWLIKKILNISDFQLQEYSRRVCKEGRASNEINGRVSFVLRRLLSADLSLKYLWRGESY